MKQILIFLLLINAFASVAQIPKGDRILSYSVSESENQSYDDAFSSALNSCMEMTHLQYPWVNYESSDGIWNQANMPLMDITNLYYPANNMALELNIGTMNTTVNSIPEDLLGVSYNSPIMINRFKNFLDTLFHHIPDVEIQLLTIGNESDAYMGTNEDLFLEYKTFLDSVVPYAKALYFEIHNENLNVGTTLTREGLTSSEQADLCHLLNDGLDIVSATYYPLQPGFQMADPAIVHEHFQELVDQYPDENQAIYFVECGYASSPACGSSEEAQSEFFSEVFTAWDDQYNNIKSISIFKTADWSQEEVIAFGEYYGIDEPAFLEFLRTLGTRTYSGDGIEKLAAETIRCELAARNWCATVICSTEIEEGPLSSFSIFPNPSSGLFTIKVNPNQSKSLRIINSLGQETLFLSSITSETIQLDLEDLPIGQYQIILYSNDHVPQGLQFIKQ